MVHFVVLTTQLISQVLMCGTFECVVLCVCNKEMLPFYKIVFECTIVIWFKAFYSERG